MVDGERQRAEIGLTDDGGNDRRQDVGHESLHQSGKGRAYDDGNGKVHDIATHDELSETLQHRTGSFSMN